MTSAQGAGPESGYLLLSTVASRVISELVLELDPHRPHFVFDRYRPPLRHWKGVNEFLRKYLVTHGDSKFFIRINQFHDLEAFQKHAKGIFPFAASLGCINLEPFRN